MTDLREAFLADILGHPDDDTPRLVFADWLEDHGDKHRGRLIRALCRGGGFLTYVPHDVGFDRIRELLELPECLRGMGFEVRRGFVSRVRCTLRDWCGGVEYLSPVNPGEAPPEIHYRAHGPALVRRHPLERVELSDRQPAAGLGCGIWCQGDRTQGLTHAHSLPGEIFDLLHRPRVVSFVAYYGDESDAISDLSRGLLLWARRVADPPL